MALRFISDKKLWDARQPIDGVKHPANIEKLWSTEDLEAIGLELVPTPTPAPQPETSTDPADYPLTPVQFRAMVELLGKGPEIEAAISGIEDAAIRAVARAKYEYSTEFERSDDLFELLAPQIGMTDADIDAAWMTAKELK